MSNQIDHEFLPAVRRGRIRQLNIYDVSQSELHLLERGSPESLYLNFAIFFLSVAVSFLIALVTTDIPSNRMFTVFVVLTVIGFVAGGVLLAIWRWHRRSTSTIFAEIRRRMPPEGIQTGQGLIIEATDNTDDQ